MKIIREYINEKFTEDSDPIVDLGIGFAGWVDLKPGDILVNSKCKTPSKYFSKFFGDYYDNYCVVVKTKINKDNLSITVIPFMHEVGIIKDIIEDVRKGIIKYGVWDNMTAPLNEWKKYFEIIKAEKILNKYVNEKFVEDSDPIKDLGIGIYTKRNFSSQEELYEWLSDKLHLILDPRLTLKEVVKYMLNTPGSRGSFLSEKYSNKLEKYVNQYTDTPNNLGVYYEDFHRFLKNKFPRIKSWIIEGKGRYKGRKTC